MKRFLYTLLVIVSLSIAKASAQEGLVAEVIDNKIATLAEQSAAQDKRIQRLEKLKQYFNISGFVQGAYDWVDDRDGGESMGTSTFHLRRARLSMTGDLYRGEKGARLDYRLFIDAVRAPNPILDLWIRYQPVKEFGVQFGQFKNPVTLDASVGGNANETIDYAYVVCNLAKMGSGDVTGLSVTARDCGFQLFGGFVHRDGFSVINYNIGVLNGNGINTKDNNTSKDIFARITIKPTAHLMLTTYYQRGEANLKSAANFDEYKWDGNPEYVTTHRWGGGFKLDNKRVFARAEYLAGLTGNLASEGAYIKGGYSFTLPKQAGILQPCLMADYYCRDLFNYTKRDSANAHVDMRYTACLGYFPVKYCRVQLAYSLEQRINYTFKNNSHFGNSVKLLVTAMF